MRRIPKSDYETVSLFVLLGVLTLLLVWGIRWVLFAPVPSVPTPPGNEIKAERSIVEKMQGFTF